MGSKWLEAGGAEDQDRGLGPPVVTKRYPLLLASSLGVPTARVAEPEAVGLLLRLRRSRRR